MEKKIVVPNEMYESCFRAVALEVQACSQDQQGNEVTLSSAARVAIEAALRWLSENPIVPTEEEVELMLNPPFVYGRPGTPPSTGVNVTVRQAHEMQWSPARRIISEWQRRMFLATDTESLTWRFSPITRTLPVHNCITNDMIVVAGIRSDGVLIEEREVVEYGDDLAKGKVVARLQNKVEARLQTDSGNSNVPVDLAGMMFGTRRTDVWADEANYRIHRAFLLGQKSKTGRVE